MPTTLARATVLRARTGSYVTFTLSGVMFAAFASRIPDVKAALDLTPGQLGVTLLGVSVGSLCSLPLAGALVDRFGAARTVMVSMAVAAVGLVLCGLVIDAEASRFVLTGCLALTGLGIGCWDASMNIEGASVERELGHTIMPRLHAAFSAGTVLSAVLGSVLSRQEVPITGHLVAVALFCLAVGWWATGAFLPRSVEHDDADTAPAAGNALGAWREPRTLLIGVVVLAAAFTEGTANDWMSVAFVDGHHLQRWAGGLGLATFLVFMTVGRVVGTGLLDRHGRVAMLRLTFLLAVAGSLLVVFGNTPLAFAGVGLWGLGASLGFPVGMSAASDDPRHAAARVSVVSTIGYLAFLGGPPLLGLLGDHLGVLHSLLIVGAMVALALFAVPVTRESRDGATSR